VGGLVESGVAVGITVGIADGCGVEVGAEEGGVVGTGVGVEVPTGLGCNVSVQARLDSLSNASRRGSFFDFGVALRIALIWEFKEVNFPRCILPGIFPSQKISRVVERPLNVNVTEV